MWGETILGHSGKLRVRGLPSNVVDLSYFRRLGSERHTVFYLNEAGRWLETLTGFPFLHVEDIDSMELLKARLLSRTPDLIILESDIQWADPVNTIYLLSSLVEAPMVMIAEATSESAVLIKQAYSAGLHDTLYAPLKREDVREALDVLLKFRRSVSTP